MFYYRVRATGQWCGAGQSQAQDPDWFARYEQALGLTAGTIEEVEADADPRIAPLLVEPPDPPIVTPDTDDLEVLVALPDPATWTNAQLKEGVVRLLRLELRRRGLLA